MNRVKSIHALSITITLIVVMLLLPVKSVLAAPLITISPTSGATGTRITVTGINFHSYIGDYVSILFNGIEITDSPKPVSPTGNFDAGFNVPASTLPGTASVSVRGPLGTIIAQTHFTVSPTEIQPDISRGFVGTSVEVNATGFYANEVITFYYLYDNVQEVLHTEMAGITGNCTCKLVIPRSPAGTHRILAQNSHGNWDDFDFTVFPSVTLSSDSGAIDDIIKITGNGFSATSEVSIYLRNSIVSYASTDKYGSFEGAFRVPVLHASTYDMSITDRNSNVARHGFTIAASASIDKASGNVGMEITVNGTGFKSGETISIEYDALEIGTTVADDGGAFTATFNIPPGTAGDHVVRISDGKSVKTITFTVESEAPPVPSLISPVGGGSAESPTQFQWQAVNDPSSPVVYGLQIASDEDFTDFVYNLAGIASTEYTPAKEDRLKSIKKGVPYYWRVKAVDSASNESEWSAPETFIIPTNNLPTWALVLLIVLSVVAVAFIFYRFRRGASYA